MRTPSTPRTKFSNPPPCFRIDPAPPSAGRSRGPALPWRGKDGFCAYRTARCGHRALRKFWGTYARRGDPCDRPPAQASLPSVGAGFYPARFTAPHAMYHCPRRSAPSSSKKGRGPAARQSPLLNQFKFIRNPRCPRCGDAAPRPGCCSRP